MPENKNLKALKKQLLNIIKEYNKIASKENFDSRVALVSAKASFETELTQDEIDDGLKIRPKNINKYFKENGPYDTPMYYNIQDNTGWFPSSICVGF